MIYTFNLMLQSDKQDVENTPTSGKLVERMDKLHNGYLVFFGPLSLDLHYLLIGPMECGWIPPEDRIDRVILELPLRLNRHIQRIQPRHTRVQLPFLTSLQNRLHFLLSMKTFAQQLVFYSSIIPLYVIALA